MGTINCVNTSTLWSNPPSQWSWKIKYMFTQDDGTHKRIFSMCPQRWIDTGILSNCITRWAHFACDNHVLAK